MAPARTHLLPTPQPSRAPIFLSRNTKAWKFKRVLLQQEAISQTEIVFRFRKDIQSVKGWSFDVLCVMRSSGMTFTVLHTAEASLKIILTCSRTATYTTPEISDHSMIYGEMTDKVGKHTSKTLVHRQTKTTDFDNLNKYLLDAPWHVGEIFDDLDDAYD